MKIMMRFTNLIFLALFTFASCSDDSSGPASETVPAPSGVTVEPGNGSVVISWRPVSGAFAYNIYWSGEPGVTELDNVIVNASAPYFQSGLINSNTYYYTVTAVNSSGESVLSQEVSATPELPFNRLVQKLQANDAQEGDRFGCSVCISGDYAIVSTVLEDGGDSNPLTDAGAVYIFHRADTGIWDAGTKITAPDAQPNDYFGYSVSINGDYAIVGALYEDGGDGDPVSNSGAAYIFHRTGTNTWDEGTKITASDAQLEDYFGCSVSINGDYAIVGASYKDGGANNNSGAAYIFHRTGTDTWDAGIKITAPDAQPNDYFGCSVSISGDYAVAGAKEEPTAGGTGSAYIYHRTGTDTWDAGIKITAPDAQAGDIFGSAVSISGDYIIVGAYQEDCGAGDPIANAGAAYIYRRIGTNVWDAGTKITATDAQEIDIFGFSVSISGDYAIVGAYFEDGGIGDPLNNSGAAYIYHRTGTNTWEEITRITTRDAQAGDYFGYSVSINGEYAVIAANQKNGDTGVPVLKAGAVYVFRK